MEVFKCNELSVDENILFNIPIHRSVLGIHYSLVTKWMTDVQTSTCNHIYDVRSLCVTWLNLVYSVNFLDTIVFIQRQDSFVWKYEYVQCIVNAIPVSYGRANLFYMNFIGYCSELSLINTDTLVRVKLKDKERNICVTNITAHYELHPIRFVPYVTAPIFFFFDKFIASTR